MVGHQKLELTAKVIHQVIRKTIINHVHTLQIHVIKGSAGEYQEWVKG